VTHTFRHTSRLPWDHSRRTIAALTADGTLAVDSVVLPDGEEHKSMEVLQAVWDKALSARLDRGATFLALGGGVIGDMTGFAAACYQRGVHFVQVWGAARLWLGSVRVAHLHKRQNCLASGRWQPETAATRPFPSFSS
jgi:hypothetical protein